jgi:3-vinyl bacteriochlorophyllide hydratase
MSHRKPALSVVAIDATDRLSGKAQASRQKTPTISHHSANPLSIDLYKSCRGQFTGPLAPGMPAVWSGTSLSGIHPGATGSASPLYTPEERRRRDASPWTIVQAALAPLQFAIFLVSLGLVVRYLATGEGLAAATMSVVVKTVALYAIMITGSIWEREVFGRYLFARPFFWEDVFSILVLALHTLYLVALACGALSAHNLMLVALAAYATYVINATQFLLKLRAARRGQAAVPVGVMEPAG